ncbi:L-dopachrome tautomerase yellow-f2-like [Phlebotomus argentipes]|uniref:L-dopachrome tautomerase yellow-f2-like n=1 Tax=Phlebotomus argentipes TaxID=94469 RepID=UPI002892A61F|nr:L-dopachrome tautomerase yellow-f2-like [Phlebotomus argentipes]
MQFRRRRSSVLDEISNEMLLFCVSWVILTLWSVQCQSIVDEYQWKEVQFANLPLSTDAYIGPFPYFLPENNDVLGSAYHAKSRTMFVAISRLREGVPSTLNAFCADDYAPGSSPVLWAFPDYKTNTLHPEDFSQGARSVKEPPEEPVDEFRHKRPLGSYSQSNYRIISVYHPIVDNECDRLFILDTGIMRNTDDTTYFVQRPALLVYDLSRYVCSSGNVQLIKRVELPESVWKNSLGFDYPTADYQYKGTCDDLFVYMNNIFDNSIVVLDYAKNDFWMFANHSSFVPVPSESQVLDNYQLNYGTMNVEVGWPDKKGNKIAYYAPGASTAEYATTTKVLKNRRMTHTYGAEFRIVGYEGCKGSIHRQFFDKNCGVMFFAHMASGQVTCWNVGKPFNPNNLGVILQTDPQEVFSEVYVDSEGYLWMHSCHIHQLLGSTEPLDLTQVNSRIRKFRVLDAIQGTVCDTFGQLPDEIAWEYFDEL